MLLKHNGLIYKQDGAEAKKIFVCPVVINYNFVLEAPGLIDQHLRISGKEKYYVENDGYSTSYKIGLFLMKFFTAKAEMSITYGRCMDLFGNNVNDEGVSLDRNGNQVDIEKYFTSDGKITKDAQRDGEYTSYLSKEIVNRYHKENLVLPSILIAFVGYQILSKRYHKLDLFAIIRLPEEDRIIGKTEFKAALGKVVDQLHEIHSEGNVRLSEHVLERDLDKILEVGLIGINTYHAKKPLRVMGDGDFTSEDMKVLYFYHNRLTGYDLHRYV